ncbi:hypothetical protein QVD17_05845 [Tagetes erecta]|uniref:Bifunctional inhibitor/plant lipid transfer protein/seed storage helical domain-containing protein n=1 Tax=Tagetes erecta TaxID=13708 RepID=A0AAD8LMC5_TARER|nr:hypothetical protein QVD17_05845 [Tagetes erecta]
MAKLIALALAFTALVAFATAHTTIVTTTIEDENPISSQRQCSQHLQGKRFNQCRMFLQQTDNRQSGQQQIMQQCCQELQNVDEQCQCEAVKQVFRDVQRQHQIGPFGSQQTQQLKQKAQMLPNQCNLQTRQCHIGSIMTTTTTITDDSNIDLPFWRPSKGSKQCSQSEMQRPVNQCQKYVQEQIWSPRAIEMTTSRQGEHQQELRQCCNELQNLEMECQCEAVKELAREMMKQPMQRQQGRQQSGEMEIMRSVIQNIPNQCDLEVQQCNIGSIMTKSNPSWRPSKGSQQCSQSEMQRPVNQCQNYVQQQIWSPGAIEMTTSRRGEHQQELRQCCNELQNLEMECQCEAIKELAREMMKQPMQKQHQSAGEMEIMRSVIQNIPNQCNLEMQQCSIPY